MHPNFPSTDLFRFFFKGFIYTANIAKNPNSDYMIVNFLCLAKNKSKLELQGSILILFNLDRSSAVPLSLHVKKILSKILSITSILCRVLCIMISWINADFIKSAFNFMKISLNPEAPEG